MTKKPGIDYTALIARVRSGDEGDAVTELYNQLLPGFKRIITSALRSSGAKRLRAYPGIDFDQILNDNFYSLIRRIRSDSNDWKESDMLSLFAAAVKNDVIDNIRQKRGKMKGHHFADAGVDEESVVDYRGRGDPATLTELIGMMPNDIQRRVLQMTYLEEIPQGDIAETLGMSDRNVRRHLDSAKRTLLRLADRHGFEIPDEFRTGLEL